MRTAFPLRAGSGEGASRSPGCARPAGLPRQPGRKGCSASTGASVGQVLRLKGPRTSIRTHHLHHPQVFPSSVHPRNTACLNSGVAYTPDPDLEMRNSSLALSSPSASLPQPIHSPGRATASPGRLPCQLGRASLPQDMLFPSMGKLS